MQNKPLYLFLSLVLLLAACRPSGANDSLEALKAQYDFAVEDTASITRIIISDKVPTRVELQRTEKGWVVGPDRHPVRTDAIEVLLQTIGSVKMKNFVKESSIETVKQRMDVYGRWVEVYAGDELVKHFIVGTETPDMLGTYYRLVDAELPFVVYLQGFNGYLTTRFFTEESLWRERTIFGLGPNEIESIEMHAPQSPGEFWMITRKLAEDISTLAPADVPESWRIVGGEFEPLEAVDPTTPASMVASVRTLKYEGAIIPSDNIYAKKDSIFSSTPAFEFSVHTTEGDTQTLRAFFKKPEGGNQMAADGTPHQWDPDRFYCELPDGRMALIQRYGFRNVLVSRFDLVQP